MNSTNKFLEHKAYNLRRLSIEMTSRAGSGHATTCLSAADILSVLFFYAMRYNPRNFNYGNNDRFILSKGHASPILYAVWKEVGVLSETDLHGYRQFDSPLEGHPTMRFSHAEAATGALGLGLSIGVGQALAAKLDKKDFHTYVLLGDGECAEGAVWEAIQLAAHYKLDNLIGIIDCNRLGQSDATMVGHNTKDYAQILHAFGWKTFEVDGHDVDALKHACDQARAQTDAPTMIIAKTYKGYGVEKAQDKLGFHGKAFKKEEADAILEELKNKFSDAASYEQTEVWQPKAPTQIDDVPTVEAKDIVLPKPQFTKGDTLATRKAYGMALAVLGGVSEAVVSLDGDVKNSTFAEIFEQKYPERFFQCFIAEQNMVSMGVGFDRRNKIPFISTFGAFMSRAYDQIRMAAIGNARLRLCGSHAGVSIGEDGPSQMGLEDISMMCALPDSVVLYPCDAVSTYKLVEQMGRYDVGISYLRTTRSATPIIYDNDESFTIGGCSVLKQSKDDKACVIGAGITLFNALDAYDILAYQDEPIHVSVIDLYSIKPLDVDTIIRVAKNAGGKIITVEDHYPEGGIGQIVAAALCNTGILVESLAVDKLPRSGKPDELMAFEGIDAKAIVETVRRLV